MVQSQSRAIRYVLVLSALAVTAPQINVAQPTKHPNFGGRWRFTSGQQPEGGRTLATDYRYMVVEHQDPRVLVKFLRSPDAKGEHTTTLMTDGSESENPSGNHVVKTKAVWNRGQLVISWATESPNGRMEHRQTWTLSPDGKTLTIGMHDGDLDASMIAVKE